MMRLTLKGLLAHRFRLAATALAVLLGVAFLAGTLVLIDTVRASFAELYAAPGAGADLVVRQRAAFGNRFGDQRTRLPQGALSRILAAPGVASAEGVVEGYAQFVGVDGKPLGEATLGRLTLGGNWRSVDELNPWRLAAGGRPPRTSAEVVIDAGTARTQGFGVGDQVTLLVNGPPASFEVVGVARYQERESPAGASMALFATPTAQRLVGQEREFDAIAVRADPGVSPVELSQRLTALLPSGAEALTAAQFDAANRDQLGRSLSFFGAILVLFVGIALAVCGFIIHNTFTIVVVGRTREIALLRALGAARSQVLGRVLGEAAILGVAASAGGAALGAAVAGGLDSLMAWVGYDVPGGRPVVTPGAVALSIAVGAAVTVVSALASAWRASRIPPIAALRDAHAEGGRGARRAGAVGGVAAALAALLVALGLGGGVGPLGPTAAVGLGGACALAALSALGPALIAPLTLLVGRRAAGVAVAAGGGVSLVAGALVLAGAAVDRYTRGFVIAAGFAAAGALLVPAGRAAFGVGGQLACRNVLRNPRRSAATASALTIGVAVVATFMIVAASLKASIGAAVDETFRGQFVVQPRALGGGGLPTDLAAELSTVPGVVAAAGLRVAQGGIDGETVQVFGVDAERMLQIFDIGLVEGSAEVLDERSIAVHAATAARRGWRLGDEVTITWATIGPARLRISGLFERAEAGDYLVSHGALERAFAEQVDVQVYVRVADTAPAAQVRADIAAVVAARPNAELLDVSGFKRVQARQVDRLFQLVVALLLLAILIALLGIWNTLALSILERRREFGLLRALGMTPAQLRDAVRWESVIIALAGTVAGLVVGVGFGWSVMRTLADSGFHTVRAPFVQLAVAALVGALAGVAAAGLPARRAAAAPVAEALSVDSPGPA